MHTRPQDDGIMAETPDGEECTVALPSDDPWFRVHTQVSQALPRLREIAIQVAVVGVLVGPIPDAWGARGC
jgi:hypothetical protein